MVTGEDGALPGLYHIYQQADCNTPSERSVCRQTARLAQAKVHIAVQNNNKETSVRSKSRVTGQQDCKTNSLLSPALSHIGCSVYAWR